MSPDTIEPLDYPISRDSAMAFDAADPLAELRAAFDLPDDLIYMVGHSLGPPPQQSLARLRQTAETEWATEFVGAWNSAGWIDYPSRLGARLSRLIGVRPETVVVCDSVSINLYKLAGALLDQPGMAKRIVVEAGEFPTDQYILEQLCRTAGADFVRSDPGQGAKSLADGGILVRSLVDYRTAEIADVEALESVAAITGGAVIWDLSHATGVVDLSLEAWGARYAVGCTYKYLNGGPGAPAFIHVGGDAADRLRTPLAGWLGHKRPFAFEPDYEPADGVARFMAGTPPILSMAALDGALDMFENISLVDLQMKTRALGDMCLAGFERIGLSSSSPRIGQPRGGHVSAHHSDGYAISRALAERGVRTDFRTPDTIRFGLSPLVLSHADVWKMLNILEEVIATESYRDPRHSVRLTVT